MKTKEFDFFLPKKNIAQKPSKPRDTARLMILDVKNKSINHDYFYNIHKYLDSTDVLVANNTKVMPARIYGRKINKNKIGGKIEILLLKHIPLPLTHQSTKEKCSWEVMVKGKIKEEKQVKFKSGLIGVFDKKTSQQTWKIDFNLNYNDFNKIIKKIGETPTPPYIKRFSLLEDYQTIYASLPGSAAAPTAGLHFTKKLIQTIKNKKIAFEYITLHIGLGTFQPIRTKNIKKHKIHSELASISPAVKTRLNQAKQKNKKIIAIGTTTTRAIESFTSRNKLLKSGEKWVNLFIFPGYKFKFINGLITNFHLPKSSLLIMVSALAGKKFILNAYKEAVKKNYRFYSFGDAMFIKNID